MNILFLGDASSVHIKKWVNFFISEGANVYLATFAHKNITNCRNIFYLGKSDVAPSGGNYHYLLAIRKLRNIIKNNNITHINAHYSYSMGFIAALALLFINRKINFSVVCHGSDILVLRYFFSKYINKFVLTRADAIFAVSKQIYNKIVEMNISSKKIFLGQYGVGEEYFSELVIDKEIDIISFRAYMPNSQWDVILAAVDSSMLNDKKIVFILPGIDEEKLYSLKNRYKHISFLKCLESEELISFVKKSKLYISATKSDGSSLSLLEAMALGCYPIVSDIEANKEWIIDGKNGVLFNSAEELRVAIIKSLDMDKKVLASIIEENRKLIKLRASYVVQMRKIKNKLMEGM